MIMMKQKKLIYCLSWFQQSTQKALSESLPYGEFEHVKYISMYKLSKNSDFGYVSDDVDYQKYLQPLHKTYHFYLKSGNWWKHQITVQLWQQKNIHAVSDYDNTF